MAELFRRYAHEGASIADLTRWLTEQGVLTRTGKSRWDRSVVWGTLRNPAYAGRAVFGKTMIIHEQPGLSSQDRQHTVILEVGVVPLADGGPHLTGAYRSLVNPGRRIPLVDAGARNNHP